MKIHHKTGNEIVDAIGQLGDKLTGPLIPYPWFTKILDQRGRPYHLAILVLAEIVGWYRPKKALSKKDNSYVFNKRFKRDRLQLSRGNMAKKFNTDEDTITHAMNCLVKLGAIEKQSYDLVEQGRIYRNSLFVWPVPEVIEKLCETDDSEEEYSPTESAEVAPIMGATWPSSQGLHSPLNGGDVAACKGPRGPVDTGDVAPMMGVDTVTGLESDRKSTATTTNSHGADAPEKVVVVVESKHAGASPPAPPAMDSAHTPARAPTAQSAKRTGKRKSVSSPAGCAKRQHGCDLPGGNVVGIAAASVPEAHAVHEDAGVGLATSASAREAGKLLKVFAMLCEQLFDRDYQINKQDTEIASQYFERHSDRLALEVANYWLRALELSDQMDGEYSYGCCKQAKTVAGFFKFLERDDGKRGIVEDVESRFNSYWNCDEEWLLKSLGKSCGSQALIREIFSDEFGQIRERKFADRQAQSKQRATDEQQRAEASAQFEVARQAQIANPTQEDIKSAHDTVYKAYQVALGISKGLSAPQARVKFSCQMLKHEMPALAEWYSHHDGRPSPGDTGLYITANLRKRLECEMKTMSDPVFDLPPIGGEKTTNKTQQKYVTSKL